MNQHENAGVTFTIWETGADREKDRPVASLKAQNKGGKAEEKWRYHYVHDPEQPLTAKPQFVFTAKSYRCAEVEGGQLEISDDFYIAVKHPDGSPAKDAAYKATLPDGSVETGRTDANGEIRIEDIVPGEVNLEIKEDEDFFIEHSAKE